MSTGRITPSWPAAQPAFRVARLLVAETYGVDQSGQRGRRGQTSPPRGGASRHGELLRRRALAVPNQLTRPRREGSEASDGVARAIQRLREEIEQAHSDGFLEDERYRRLQALSQELARSTGE